MFCPKCGAKIGDRSVFCTNCGTRLQAPVPQPTQARPVQTQTPVQPSQSTAPVQPNPLASITGDLVKLFSYLSCAANLLAMILWLCIKFEVTIFGITKATSLYEAFFEPTHTTFLTVFVVLGFLAGAVFTVLPNFNLGFIKKSTSYKIALQSSIVANVLGIFSLHACLAMSEHDALEYMNFAGWTCFLFAFIALALCILTIRKTTKAAKK